jgi:hypothetical protein
MSSVELTPARERVSQGDALVFCDVPVGSRGICPVVSRTTVTLSTSAKTLRMCPTHAYIADDLEHAEVIWDDPKSEPLAVALYEQHHRGLDGQVGKVNGDQDGGAL